MDTSDSEIAGPSSGVGTFDIFVFNRLSDIITTSILQIGKHAVALERELKTIGTPKDTEQRRDSVYTVITAALRSINEGTTALLELSSLSKVPTVPPENVGGVESRTSKLTSDFQQVVQRFTKTQKQIVGKIKTLTNQAKLQYQQQIQQLQYEQDLLLRREQIEADFIDVTQTMNDLAVMAGVPEIHAVQGQEETETTELLEAEYPSRSKYLKWLYLVIAGLIIAGVVVGITLLVRILKS